VDRQGIERHDFPLVRRGYDTAEVDAHLRRVADEFEHAAAGGHSSLAAGTSEQVRLILEAAERSAADLREDAGRQASGHVARVADVAEGLLTQLDDLQVELGRVVQGVRDSGERLAEGLRALQQRVGEVEPPAAAPVEPEPEEDFAAAAPVEAAPGADETGARIIALNMALSGTPRDETAAYLAEHFGLEDPEPLLDDVYERAGR
jgi:DivIVA domain-containing protein